ncbi:hypothetical protein [Flavobacterium sp. CAU 1735]|uniref:hypothetical protein n=1 Tax=Flavobacterium sp. CAU 1735 TaxID=3140361 RepID=UPI003260F057
MRNLNGTPTATEEGVLAFGSLPLWFIGGNAGATQAEASTKLFGETGQVAKTGTSVLGKYPDYINLASELGAKRFNVPASIWNKMTPVQQWAANQKFLDRMIMRGDKIILSNPVLDVNKVSGAFRLELDYLIGKGYRLNSTGTQLIK